MAKPKALTPQEIYRQRKERDEKERTAYLPPGLINHGNTCFMNSVLQGLIATRLLSDLVHFHPIPAEIQRTAATPIVSRRSPQLTNGHNLAGPDEQAWVNTMPIGDMFLTLLYKAWDSQEMRRRDVLSPKSILGALGQKYDQYLDFAQQDAHEFLRILLDAMRMEEQDIIKKRQPPPPPNHHKKRRRTTITPGHTLQDPVSGSPLPSTSSADNKGAPPSVSTEASLNNPDGDAPGPDQSLLSFADMVFGGQLTSILVCQKCKHVSQTYEEFNDISLSIKAEDYFPHNRKRDRLKKIVGRLTTFPGSSSQGHSSKDSRKAALHPLVQPSHVIEMQRSSSVPPSPRVERIDNPLRGGDDEHLVAEPPRRRSLDVPVKGAESGSESPDMSTQASTPVVEMPNGHVPADAILPERDQADDGTVESEHSHVIVNVTGPDDKHVEFIEPKIIRTERLESGQDESVGKEKENGKQNESGNSKEKDGKEKEKDKSHKQDDSWAKLGRRISLSVGLGRPKGGDKDKEKKDRDRKGRSMDRGGGLSSQLKEIKEVAMEAADLGMKKSLSAPASSSKIPGDSSHDKRKISSDGRALMFDPPSFSSNAVASSTETQGQKPKPLPSPPSISPNTSHSTGNDILAPQPVSSHLQAHPTSSTPSIFPNVQRSKSPKPPKPSNAEAEYLRKILADVSTSPSSNNPFAIFKPPLLHSHSAFSSSTASMPNTTTSSGGAGHEKNAGATWLGMGMRNFSGIEECLRMFTAVEVLDGENMVGCRRCWKIQNGVYHGSKEKHEDSDQEEEEDRLASENEPGGKDPIAAGQKLPHEPLQAVSSTLSAGAVVRIPTSLSTPTVSLYSQADTSDTRSISSLPTAPTSTSEVSLDQLKENDGNEDSRLFLSVISEGNSEVNSEPDFKGPGPGGLPIPVISTTSPPETPTSWSTSGEPQKSSAEEVLGDLSDTNREASYARLVSKENGVPGPSSTPTPHPRLTQALYGYNTSPGSKDSLVIPQIGRPKYQKRKSYSDSTTTDNDSSGDESDTSIGTSVSADSTRSSPALDLVQSNGSKPAQNPVTNQAASIPMPPQKAPKPPKPVIMRPAYKRYLIAVPPPVLVIHLKRFQQTAKTPLMSFSHGFKKLEDYISFPEYLDLLPFLAPRKEDYGLGKKGKGKGKEKVKKAKAKAKEERCVYRLYAVVVHIGNMLGGHYIAYTALPEGPAGPATSAIADDARTSTPTFAGASETTGEKENLRTDSAQPTKPTERQWAYISDTTVRLTTLEEVLHAKAYICMYERC